MDERRVVKWLIVAAVAVVVLVEGATFLTLLGQTLLPGAEATPTQTTEGTPTPESVSPGDELLANTTQRETLTTATIQSGDEWTLTLSVTVENTGDRPYQLSMGTVHTGDGRRHEASAATGRLAPGESGTASAQWSLPSGSIPEAVTVSVRTYENGSVVETTERRVPLGSIPVQG